MKQNKKTKQRTDSHKWPKTAIAAIIVYVIFLFLPFISPYARYPLYVIKCGGRPIVASNFAAGYFYRLPSDKGYGISAFTDHYFCSESEAKSAGYNRLYHPNS